MQISQRLHVLRSWFNVRLKDHCMAVLTHFQRMPYDIFSLLYVLIFRCCILLLGTVYIGSELIEISEPINVVKIFLASFLFIFSNWCVGWLWFFDWHNDWNQEYVSDTLNIFVECTEKFSEAFENNKQVSVETKNLCQNFPTPFFIEFLSHFLMNYYSVLEFFLWTLRTCSRYLQDPRYAVLCGSKTIWTALHDNLIL